MFPNTLNEWTFLTYKVVGWLLIHENSFESEICPNGGKMLSLLEEKKVLYIYM